MALWKISDKGPVPVTETTTKKEKLLESDLENWVAISPAILGEPLFLVGRQVIIPDVKDRLDLLAIDSSGNAVVIELKIGHLKDPVDIQALRYASYISKWRFEDFERQARLFYGNNDFNFNNMFEAFCEEAGLDEAPEINADQRMIVVGSGVKDKLGSVALWLREHKVDIKVIEIRSYKEGDSILIEPAIIIPLPVSKFIETGSIKGDGPPWMVDGKSWHLDHRCSQKTQQMVIKLDDILRDNFELDGPRWNQKHYISYRINNYNWLAIITSPKTLRLDILVKKGSLDSEKIAKMLGVQKFDIEESMSEKLSLPSSVLIKNRNEGTDRILLRIKDDFDLSNASFISFLKDAYSAFPK